MHAAMKSSCFTPLPPSFEKTKNLPYSSKKSHATNTRTPRSLANLDPSPHACLMHMRTTTTTRSRILLRPSTISSSSSSQRRCPDLAAAAAFCSSSLPAGVSHLDGFSSDDGAGGLPVRWCADAMRLVKRTQRDLIAAFWSSSAAEEARRFDGEGDGEEWLDLEKYMEETAALLDLCNALKSAAARLRRRCMAADFAAAAGGGDEESAEVRGSGELREAAEMLGSVVDQVFDEVIRGRNEMLGILRDKALA